MMRRECSVHHCPHAPGCGGKSARGDAHMSVSLRTRRVNYRFRVSLLHGKVSQLTQTQRRAAHLKLFEMKMSVKHGAQVQMVSVRAEANDRARGCFPQVELVQKNNSPTHIRPTF